RGRGIRVRRCTVMSDLVRHALLPLRDARSGGLVAPPILATAIGFFGRQQVAPPDSRRGVPSPCGRGAVPPHSPTVTVPVLKVWNAGSQMSPQTSTVNFQVSPPPISG